VTVVHRTTTIFAMLAVAAGMHERAKLIGGDLEEVWSWHRSGTEVELNSLAAITHAASPTGRLSRLLTRMPLAKKTGTTS
jgi:hypothetical protein